MENYKITLNNGKILRIWDNHFSGLTPNQLDLTPSGLWDIETKEEFLNYIKIKWYENNAIGLSKPILKKELGIDIVYQSPDRFALYDCGAYSGDTKIILEYKYRSGCTHNTYPSIVIDQDKYNNLIEFSRKHNNIPIYMINCYENDAIRVIKLNDAKPDYITKKKITERKYKQKGDNNTKEQTLLHFNNNKTLLFN